MWREGKSPSRHAGIVENRLQLSLQQTRIEQQKKRGAWVCHVHRVDRTVAEVLLGKEKRRAVHVGSQLMGSDGLPISKCTKFCVRFTTGRHKISHELLVELS